MGLFFILSFALWISGCAEKDRPVATIGEQAISAEQLQGFVQRLSTGLKSQSSGQAARREYLQSFIDRHLLLTDATEKGLDTLRAIDRKVREDIDARILVLYRARFLAPQAAVSEEEVRRVYEEEDYNRERNLNAILVSTRAEIEEVLAKLQAGQSFAEVARAHSLDDRSADNDGELGFIGREAAPGLHVPAEIFKTLPIGEISKPLPAGRSWHVVRFTEDRPTPYERYRPLIENTIFNERMNQVESEHLEKLRASTDTKIDPKSLSLMLNAVRQRNTGTLDSSSAILYHLDNDPITVSAAWRALQRTNSQRSLDDSLRAIDGLDYWILRPVLLRSGARAEGLYADPEIKRVENRIRESALLNAIRAHVGATDLLSDAEVWAFYESHPERFYHEESIQVEELLINDLTDAIEIKERIAAGAEFAEFADRSVRRSAINTKARFHFHRRDKAVYPQLVPAVTAAESGQLMGPLRVQGGYSIFRVEGLNPGSVEPYEAVQNRARALLRRERENQAFNALVKDLRQRHADRITIDEERLREALPDSLVSGS